MSEEMKELKSENKEAPKQGEATKAEAPKQEAPKTEAPKPEVPKAEAPKAEAPKAEEQAKTPDAKKPEGKKIEKSANCSVCNKSIRKKRYYYRNGKYFCTKRCWTKTAAKEKKETGEKKAETEAKQ